MESNGWEGTCDIQCLVGGDLVLLQHGQCVPVLAAAGPHAGDVLQDPPVERAAPREIFLGEGAHLPVLHCTQERELCISL